MAGKAVPKLVLLIEDDVLISDILARKLSQSGFTVLQALSGSMAFEILASSRPDVILLDILLPGMNGFEILQKLKENSSFATIPVIMLSNINEQAQIEKAKDLGAVDYLVKISVPLEDVVKKVRSICVT